MPRFDPSLYLVTAPVHAFASPSRWLEYIAQAVEGGVTLVQFRDKALTPKDSAAVIAPLKELLRPYHVPLLVNDSAELCRESGAGGVHLGQRDGDPQRARELLGAEAVIGLSLETLNDLEKFNRTEQYRYVDYVAVSPVFPTATKWDVQEPLGLAGLRKIKESVGLPVVAIGGVTLHNLPGLIQNGADGVAVISALATVPSPRDVARQFKKRIDKERQASGWLLPYC